jgi:hypothetical protein
MGGWKSTLGLGVLPDGEVKHKRNLAGVFDSRWPVEQENKASTPRFDSCLLSNEAPWPAKETLPPKFHAQLKKDFGKVWAKSWRITCDSMRATIFVVLHYFPTNSATRRGNEGKHCRLISFF